jgi:hypothetical protein
VTQHCEKSIAVPSVTLFVGGHRLCHGAIDGVAEPGYLFSPVEKTIRVGFTPQAQYASTQSSVFRHYLNKIKSRFDSQIDMSGCDMLD